MKLRVWWISQVGTKPFYIPIDSIKEGKKIMDVLSYFDCFQYNQRIRTDYCNAGGIEMFDEETNEWVDWVYETEEDYYEDVNDYIEAFCSEDEKKSLIESANEMRSQVKFD